MAHDSGSTKSPSCSAGTCARAAAPQAVAAAQDAVCDSARFHSRPPGPRSWRSARRVARRALASGFSARYAASRCSRRRRLRATSLLGRPFTLRAGCSREAGVLPRALKADAARRAACTRHTSLHTGVLQSGAPAEHHACTAGLAQRVDEQLAVRHGARRTHYSQLRRRRHSAARERKPRSSGVAEGHRLLCPSRCAHCAQTRNAPPRPTPRRRW